jgi:transcriptional regulator with XRE-family HTH domain
LPGRKRTASAKAPDHTDAVVGRNICIRRLAAGMAQGELAERLGVSFQQVQKYEKGVNRVSGGRLVRVAKILQVPVTALFEGLEDPQQASALIAERTAYRLAVAFAKLRDRRIRRSLIALAETIAGDRSRS